MQAEILGDGTVRQIGSSVVPVAGGTVLDLTDDQEAQWRQVIASSPPPGKRWTGWTFAAGLFAGVASALPAPPPPPTFALLAGAGAGATGSVAGGSNDLLMAGSIHTGTAPAAGDFLAVAFGTPRAAAPLGVTVQAQNVQAGTLIAKNISATGFTIATAAVPAATTTYSLLAEVKG